MTQASSNGIEVRPGLNEGAPVRSTLCEDDWDEATIPDAPAWIQEDPPMTEGDDEPTIPWWRWEDLQLAREPSLVDPATQQACCDGADQETTQVRASRARQSRARSPGPRFEDPDALLWVRTEGRLIGPVTRSLLLRGIAAGRVPADAQMLSIRDRTWRPLSTTAPFADALLRYRQRGACAAPEGQPSPDSL